MVALPDAPVSKEGRSNPRLETITKTWPSSTEGIYRWAIERRFFQPAIHSISVRTGGKGASVELSWLSRQVRDQLSGPTFVPYNVLGQRYILAAYAHAAGKDSGIRTDPEPRLKGPPSPNWVTAIARST
jgi:hypothetical protein